jgi:hypothetical protein
MTFFCCWLLLLTPGQRLFFRPSAPPTCSAHIRPRAIILGKRPPASAAYFGTLATTLDLNRPQLPILAPCVPLAGPWSLLVSHGIGSFRSCGRVFLGLSSKLHCFSTESMRTALNNQRVSRQKRRRLGRKFCWTDRHHNQCTPFDLPLPRDFLLRARKYSYCTARVQSCTELCCVLCDAVR